MTLTSDLSTRKLAHRVLQPWKTFTAFLLR